MRSPAPSRALPRRAALLAAAGALAICPPAEWPARAGAAELETATGTAGVEWPRLAVRSATLKNGLQVLVVERHASPTVAIYLQFGVGQADEKLGTLGLSHMLEHVLFKGSRHLNTRDYGREAPLIEEIDRAGVALDRERARGGEADAEEVRRLEQRLKDLLERQRKLIIKDEMEEILLRAGAGTINGSTWNDATNYFFTLPSNRVELGLAVLGEQMAEPVLREFYPERDVVMEERRLRVEDDPEGRLLELVLGTAFLAHPYRNSDWMSELRRLTRQDAQRHYETYYGANNAVLAIAGDVEFEKLMPAVERHFSRLPRREEPPPVRVEEPPQAGERRALLEFDSEPSLAMAYHIPALSHPDEPELALLTAIMAGHGTSTAFEAGLEEIPTPRWSRLYRRLVEERGVAQEIYMGGYPGDRYPRVLLLMAAPRAPHSLLDLEEAVLEELGRLGREPVPEEEIERARRNLRSLYLRRLETNLGVAWAVGFTHGVTGDWKSLERFVGDLQKVTPADIQRVARAYLRDNNRTVVWLVGPAAEDNGKDAGEAEGARSCLGSGILMPDVLGLAAAQ